jgi:hypothetical protein
MGSGHFSGTTWSWDRVESILRHIEVLNGHQDSIWVVRELWLLLQMHAQVPNKMGKVKKSHCQLSRGDTAFFCASLVAEDGVQRVILHSMHFRESFENEDELTSNTGLDLMSRGRR